LKYLPKAAHSKRIEIGESEMSTIHETVPTDAYDALAENPQAQLIDCRTRAEWNFVGMPDLSALPQDLICLEWTSLEGQPNEAFVPTIEAHLEKETPIFIMCHSGARSSAACQALAANGFTNLYNVIGGFEGDANPDGHRGTKNGWKAAQLPWRQS
jgi:rhodanese-related sulfurtransferase